MWLGEWILRENNDSDCLDEIFCEEKEINNKLLLIYGSFHEKKTIEICGKIADLAIFFVKLEKSVYKIVDT